MARFRRECYERYNSGDTIVTKQYGGLQVRYQAISPKNYWHLCIGSQHEDKFMGRVFSDCIVDTGIVLDIGAHTGMYAIPFAKVVGTNGKVYAFEPEPDGFAAIQRNAQLNGLTNIVPMNMALSDREGQISFYIRPDKDTHSIFEETSAPSPLGVQHRMDVQSATIDGLVGNGTIQAPDFVKIDVEGAELRVLTGMTKTAKSVKHLLVEIHEHALGLDGVVDPKAAVEMAITGLGFSRMRYLDRVHLLASRD